VYLIRSVVSVYEVCTVIAARIIPEGTRLDRVVPIAAEDQRICVVARVDAIAATLATYRVVILVAADCVAAITSLDGVVSRLPCYDVWVIVPDDRVAPGITKELMWNTLSLTVDVRTRRWADQSQDQECGNWATERVSVTRFIEA
jgi:hypothetical protein